MNKMYNHFCNNCGKTGHSYNQCSKPITSLGVITFNKNINSLKFLLICRKDSLGYVEFIRGKYPLYNKDYIQNIINEMMDKFENLKEGTKIITILGPLPECLPDKVDFPYIINKIPLKKAQNMQEQLLSIFGVKCVDFITAWEFAERYTKSIGSPEIKNDRFLTIIQTLVIWINAKKLGVACGEGIPESIQTYINIMKMYFDIDFEYLLKE